jgi:hypothetical protein
MVPETREATQLVAFEENDYGLMLFKTAQGHIVVRADEDGGIYLDGELLEKYKTSFYRLQVNQGGVVLTPARITLEIVEEEENLLGGSMKEPRPLPEENAGCKGREQEPVEVSPQ